MLKFSIKVLTQFYICLKIQIEKQPNSVSTSIISTVGSLELRLMGGKLLCELHSELIAQQICFSSFKF